MATGSLQQQFELKNDFKLQQIPTSFFVQQ